MTLANVKAGSTVKVIGVKEGEAKRRLLDFGFVPNTEVTVNNISPFGKTMLVALRGYIVALRENAASEIMVEKL